MARRKTRVVTRTRTRTVSPRVQIVRVPSGVTRRRRAGAVARRGLTAAGKAAADEKHTIAAVAASAGLGFLKRQSVDLPKIEQLGTAGTYGVAAWLAARMTKSRTMSHVATGMLSVAAFQLASGETLTGYGDGDDDW